MEASNPAYSVRDGREVALQMLHELEELDTSELSPCAIEPEDRGGKPQFNILLKYLDAIDRAGSRELKIGFSEILTGYLSCAMDGAIPDSDYLERYLEAR